MYSKYINKSFKLILMGLIISLIIPNNTNSKSLLINNNNNFLNKFTTSRFLQENRLQDYIKFSSDSIFYKLEYPKNDITGTGDQLQDSPYRALCIIKQCPNTCCFGEIDNLVCGTSAQCKQFYDYSILGNVLSAILITLLFFGIFSGAFCCFYKKYKKFWPCVLLAFICMFIITIPFVIYVLWKYKIFDDEKEKKG